MNSFVMDANVAAKWYVEELGTKEAVAYRGQRLIAPDLVLVEVANVLWRKLDRGEVELAQLTAALQSLPHAFDLLVPSPDLLARAVELAVQVRHPVCDCLYLALAERAAVPLVTDDAKLLVKGAMAQVRVTALRG